MAPAQCGESQKADGRADPGRPFRQRTPSVVKFEVNALGFSALSAFTPHHRQPGNLRREIIPPLRGSNRGRRIDQTSSCSWPRYAFANHRSQAKGR